MELDGAERKRGGKKERRERGDRMKNEGGKAREKWMRKRYVDIREE